MDEAVINEAINQQIITRLDTPETLAQCGWYQELGEAEQQMVRTVLYAGLPAHYNPAIETTLIALIGLVAGYELILQNVSAAPATHEAPHAE